MKHFISILVFAMLAALTVPALQVEQGEYVVKTSAPSSTDDVTEGFRVGTVWIDTSDNTVYQCMDNTDGSATWLDASSGAGDTRGLSDVQDVAPSDNNVLIWNDTESRYEPGAQTAGGIDTEDSGTLVLSNAEPLNFASNLSVTDDGDGSVTIDASTGGTDVAVDFTNDGSDEIAALPRINIENDTNSIITQYDTDEILIDFSNNVPGADLADDLTVGAFQQSDFPVSTDFGEITTNSSKSVLVDSNIIDMDNMADGTIVIESEGISSNDNDTMLPTSAAVKDYTDNAYSAGTNLNLSGTTFNVNNITEADSISSNDVDTAVPTGAAVKDYVDNASHDKTYTFSFTSPVDSEGDDIAFEVQIDDNRDFSSVEESAISYNDETGWNVFDGSGWLKFSNETSAALGGIPSGYQGNRVSYNFTNSSIEAGTEYWIRFRAIDDSDGDGDFTDETWGDWTGDTETW